MSFSFNLDLLGTKSSILQQINVKMSIWYTVLGFEPTTSRTRVCPHNHKTGDPDLGECPFASFIYLLTCPMMACECVCV